MIIKAFPCFHSNPSLNEKNYYLNDKHTVGILRSVQKISVEIACAINQNLSRGGINKYYHELFISNIIEDIS